MKQMIVALVLAVLSSTVFTNAHAEVKNLGVQGIPEFMRTEFLYHYIKVNGENKTVTLMLKIFGYSDAEGTLIDPKPQPLYAAISWSGANGKHAIFDLDFKGDLRATRMMYASNCLILSETNDSDINDIIVSQLNKAADGQVTADFYLIKGVDTVRGDRMKSDYYKVCTDMRDPKTHKLMRVKMSSVYPDAKPFFSLPVTDSKDVEIQD